MKPLSLSASRAVRYPSGAAPSDYAIPFIRVGGKILYDKDDLRAWLESRKVTK